MVEDPQRDVARTVDAEKTQMKEWEVEQRWQEEAA